jgi:hypothetical protein
MVFSTGELLLDQQRFEEAVKKFDKPIELEKLEYGLLYSPSSSSPSIPGLTDLVHV